MVESGMLYCYLTVWMMKLEMPRAALLLSKGVRQFQIADLGGIDLVAMLVELLPHHQADCLHFGWVIDHPGGDLEAIPKNGENCPVFNELRRVHMTFIKQTN